MVQHSGTHRFDGSGSSVVLTGVLHMVQHSSVRCITKLTGGLLVVLVGVAQHQRIVGARPERVLVHGHWMEVRVRVCTFGLIRRAAVIVPYRIIYTHRAKEILVLVRKVTACASRD